MNLVLTEAVAEAGSVSKQDCSVSSAAVAVLVCSASCLRLLKKTKGFTVAMVTQLLLTFQQPVWPGRERKKGKLPEMLGSVL